MKRKASQNFHSPYIFLKILQSLLLKSIHGTKNFQTLRKSPEANKILNLPKWLSISSHSCFVWKHFKNHLPKITKTRRLPNKAIPQKFPFVPLKFFSFESADLPRVMKHQRWKALFRRYKIINLQKWFWSFLPGISIIRHESRNHVCSFHCRCSSKR
jgi:hypothetical protein